MQKTTPHLDDEHMKLYEWSGASAGMACTVSAKSKRTHPWHASHGVLAVLTSLLILSACDSKNPVEQASEQVVEQMKHDASAPQDQTTAPPMPAAPAGEAAGHAMDETPPVRPAEQSTEKAGEAAPSQ
jgi:hypothetical protein